MSENTVVIKLTRGAMDSLIQENSELKVQLSQQVVEQFAKRNLYRSLENSPSIKKIMATAEATNRAWLEQQFGKCTSYGSVELSSTFRETLHASLRKEIADIVKKELEIFKPSVEAIVKAEVDVFTTNIVRDQVKKKVDEAVRNLK